MNVGEMVGSLDTTGYVDCMNINHDKVFCAQEQLSAQLEGRIPCERDAKHGTSPSVEDYCAPKIEIPDCVYCPELLIVDKCIEKVILDDT